LKYNSLIAIKEILSMAATFEWWEYNGTGPTSSGIAADVNWKNIDDRGTAYTSNPITAGNNSYEKWQYGKFSGAFNQISAGLYGHTAGTFGAGITLKGPPLMAADGNKLTYATPATTTNASLTKDMSLPAALTVSGIAVWFGGSTPVGTKTATSTAVPTFTNFLTTQLQTTGSAGAGDTTQVTMTLQYDEN
jgi:hypothetical protein